VWGLLSFAGILAFIYDSVTEPIRRVIPSKLTFYQAQCEQIDLANRILHCRAALESNQDKITVAFDKLVIAVGASSNTFNIAGVDKHAFFLKDICDARSIRHRVIECFENAKHPGLDIEEIRRLLHFCIVGGGPTGIEFSAELHDFVWEDLRKLYPDLFQFVRITVYDVAKRILSGFDASLADYAAKKFARENIEIVTGMAVKEVNNDGIVLHSGERVRTGMIVWATGLTPNNLVAGMEGVLRESRTGRLLTDHKLFLLDQFGKPIEGVYAIGDCSTIDGYDLPCTAQVAKQKAKYLRTALNSEKSNGFVYRYAGSMAYIGGWRAIADIPFSDRSVKQRGWVAWLFWRSAYFSMAVSIRNKILIPMYWFLTWAFGRDISKI
jgi:NADH dehydrogenase FAD-containing subunit